MEQALGPIQVRHGSEFQVVMTNAGGSCSMRLDWHLWHHHHLLEIGPINYQPGFMETSPLVTRSYSCHGCRKRRMLEV